MIASSKVGQELENIQAKINQIQADLEAIPAKCQQEQAGLRTAAQQAFNKRKADQLAKISACCAAKRTAASELLDTFPDLGTQEFAGKYEVKDLEEHLRTIYPVSLVDDYICLNPVIFEDEQEAYKVYSQIENSVIGLRQGNFSGKVFQGLSDLLDSAADQPQIGMKVVGGVIVFLVGGLVLSPFLFLTVFSVLGLASAVQGIRVQQILRQLFSVKLFLNEAYDEDIFAADKADIMDMVDECLENAEQEYKSTVEGRVFEFDESQLEDVKKKYNLEEMRLRSQLDLQNQAYGAKQGELTKIIQKLDELAEQEKKYAEIARKKFLGSVEWKKEWLQNIFLEVTPENKVKVMPYAQGNSLYYSKDPDNLKKLSRLLVFQSIIQMHPDYCCNFVLDYKYNGGDLTQFVTVPERIVKICYSEEDLTKQSEFINNEIRSRTNNILGSCESIEEFNALMAKYDSAGEYYVVVHIFGCTALPQQLLNNIRNGPRVGYFFKFYWTVEEMQNLKDVLPLDAMLEFYEVTDNPVPRMPAVVRRLVEGPT